MPNPGFHGLFSKPHSGWAIMNACQATPSRRSISKCQTMTSTTFVPGCGALAGRSQQPTRRRASDLKELRRCAPIGLIGYDWRAGRGVAEQRRAVPHDNRRARASTSCTLVRATRTRLPLVLTHGWPGSVVEFLEVIEPLNEAGFHCVVPSLPGYGWSDKPAGAGWDIQRIARAWAH